jgi:predicted nucleotidyltransferase
MMRFQHQKVALEVAASLVQQGVHAVAVTGSAGRGQATAASDVDLWLLWDRDERVHLSVRGMPVTLLTQTFARAVTLENLALYDVDDLWVLHDPKLLFARLKRLHAQNRRHLRANILEASLDALLDATRRSLVGSAWHRVQQLREVAWRAASLWLFDAHGWRISKVRHMKAHLPAPARPVLLKSLGLPLSPSAFARLEASWRKHARAWLRGTTRRELAPALVQHPSHLRLQLALGHGADAVMAVRRLLDLDLLPHALAQANQWDPALLETSPTLRETWRTAHALPQDPWDPRLARSTASAVATLCARLETARHFADPEELRELWELARRA